MRMATPSDLKKMNVSFHQTYCDQENWQIDMAVHRAKTQQTTLQSQAQGTQTYHDWLELTNWHDFALSKDTDHLAIAGTGQSDMSWLSRTYKLTVLPAKTQTTLQSQAQGTQDMSWLSRTYKLTWLCSQQRHRPPCNCRHRKHVMIE